MDGRVSRVEALFKSIFLTRGNRALKTKQKGNCFFGLPIVGNVRGITAFRFFTYVIEESRKLRSILFIP